MKNSNLLPLIFALSFFVSSCHNSYTYTDYSPSPINNLRIAILPYQIHTTGRITEELTEEQINDIEANEQVAFQTSMYHQFLNRLTGSDYAMNVQVQHFSETNRLIKDGGYQMDQLSNLSAAELTALLQVDAIVRSNVHKQIFLTDMESFGIEIARDIIIIFGNPFPWWYISGKSGEIRVSSSIVSAENGTTLWADSRKCNSDWNRDTYDTIERINYLMAKRMPI